MLQNTRGERERAARWHAPAKFTRQKTVQQHSRCNWQCRDANEQIHCFDWNRVALKRWSRFSIG
ncbi:hypothetical protein [Paraburkholderia phenoliruptrix]|uniref:hypothetical protein n=1 Tax=Paraburkholderia phenoliruptrix TaxID=252970 RepID=UPI000A789B81|nr:hypothetical protein [Paraburkholderia phenoliruptrix]